VRSLRSLFLVGTRHRSDYLLCLIAGLVAVAIFTPFTFLNGLSSPAGTGLFVYVMTVFPVILAAVSYSAMGLLEMRKPARASSLTFSIMNPRTRTAIARRSIGEQG